ncbi:MAG TPA: hypothetical protein VJH75_03340 [Patescibacteria group bacterium]|nr:hypothetical protein [Patescibacteria group bacterium]
MSERFRRTSLGIILTFFIIVFVGSFVLVRPAKAFPVTVLSDLQAQIQAVYASIKDNIKQAIIQAAINALSSAMKKMAYDSAVWLASGGKGQSPFAHTSSFGDYMEQVADDAGGRFIEDLGNGLHLNLCNIPDVRADLALRIGLKQRYNPDTAIKAECKFSEFIENWSSGDNWASQYGSEEALLKRFNASIRMEDTDFGIYLATSQQIDQTILRQQDAEKFERLEGGGWKAMKSLISGQTLTPAQQIQHEANANLPSAQTKRSEQQIGAALGSGSVAGITSAMSVFLNTLSSQMIKNFQTKGILPFGLCLGETGGEHCKNDPEQPESIQRIGGRRAAEALFADYLSSKVHSVSDYPILEEFIACDDAYNASPNNCTIDQSFVKAVEEARYSDPLTIRQAVDKTLLNGSWKLISPKNKALNNDKNCRNSAFCYNNIKKLRLAGILPLGFEIAALQADPDAPASLDDYLKGFGDCNYIDPNNKALGIINDQSDKPYCHLIDPNWILKVDSARCNAKVFGNEVAPSGDGSRMEECVDLSTCVGYNPDGSCYSYGYCLRSQNYWDFDLDNCDRQYATCKVFTDNTGNNVSYLARTLQTEDCNKENAGCTAYSLFMNLEGKWMAPYIPKDIQSFGVIWAWLEPYESTAVHFNGSVDSSCSTQSAGCSAFKVANSPDKVLSLKKAPNYLHCYDTTLTGTVAVAQGNQWPETYADLQKVKAVASPECSNYAGVCIEEEVGCALYTPLSYLGRDIPGKFKPAEVVAGQLQWNDQCDQSCVGYDAYKEMPSTYSSGYDPVYIIPSSNATCRIEDDGCSSFTNLSTAIGQQENVEYYSYLRACVNPGNNVTAKNFYTYEGSIVGGYQLQVFTLQADSTGRPRYNPETERANYELQCNAALYSGGQASPDCRQFNDEAGLVYYALLSKTIVVSNECTPYRLNVTNLRPAANLGNQASCLAEKGRWTGSGCEICYQNGEYKDGFCYYYGLPAGVESKAGGSRSCSAGVESCRPYKGNAANRTQKIFEDTFESGSPDVALAGWNKTAGVLNQSPESTHRGEHSLGYNGASNFYKTVPVHPGRSYVLSFWAKGQTPESTAASSLTVTFQSSMGTFGSIGYGNVWQNFRLGPIEYTGTSSSTLLRFAVTSNSQVFLDNVQLLEVTDYLYLVKNKLTVPDVCDSNKLDDQPGEALGCSAYRSTGGEAREFYLTGFSYLCRDEALGCTALLDTHNTVEDPGPSAYNVWFSGTSGSLVQRTVKGKEYSCQIPVGKSGCYVNIQGATAAEILAPTAAGPNSFVTSTQYIPADTPTSSPIYLVANREGSCNSIDLGCTIAGKQEFGPNVARYTTTTIKNLPANYNTTLCTSEAVGCSAYGFNQGTTYFKDPNIFGNKICEYKTGVAVGGVKSNGWFWKGVGKCSNAPNNYCNRQEDCGVGNTCENIGSQPCYQDYVQNGEYGLWSAGNQDKYKNFVGECPTNQASCTEFVDHNKDANIGYYFLNNSKLRTKQDACQGQVSEKAGCILLDQTDQPSKYWNTATNYLLSEKNGFAAVAPDPNLPGTKDANLIVKVTQDRKCSEWLACNSSQTVFDPDTNAYKEVCADLGVCNKAQLSDTIIGQCASWVDTGKVDSSNQVLKGKLLSDRVTAGASNVYNYRRRDVSFYGKDFTGYTLFDSYQIDDLSFSSDPDDKGLGFNNGNRFVSPTNIATSTIPTTCRGFPDAFAPFPFGTNFSTTVLPKFCTKGEEDCDCNYTKVVYGKDSELEMYYGIGLALENAGICNGGVDIDGNSKTGRKCSKNFDCADERDQAREASTLSASTLDGTCLFPNVEKSKRYIGWEGYCLELNKETGHCDLWYPIDAPTNALNRYNLYSSAGYVPPNGSGQFWCIQAKGNSNRSDAIEDISDGYKFTSREDDDDIFPRRSTYFPESGSNETGYFTANSLESTLHYSEVVAVGVEPTNYRDGKDWPTEFLVFREQELSGKPESLGVSWSKPLHLLPNGDLAMELTWHSNPAAQRFSFDGLTKVRCQSFGAEGGGYNALAIRFVFSRENGRLIYFRSRMCDASPNDGGFKMNLNFYLTEVCNDIRQVVNYDLSPGSIAPFGFEAKGRTDRLWPGSGYKMGNDGGESYLQLKYDQAFAPFGSFSQTNIKPETRGLDAYIRATEDSSVLRNAFSDAGYWPIWLSVRGATPLNCVGENNGSCLSKSFCIGGPNAGGECDSTKDNGFHDAVCKEPFVSSCEPVRAKVCFDGPKKDDTCTSDSDCNGTAEISCVTPSLTCIIDKKVRDANDIQTFMPCGEEGSWFTRQTDWDEMGDCGQYDVVRQNAVDNSDVRCMTSHRQVPWDDGPGLVDVNGSAVDYTQPLNLKYCNYTIGEDTDYGTDPETCTIASDCQPSNEYTCGYKEEERCVGGPKNGLLCGAQDSDFCRVIENNHIYGSEDADSCPRDHPGDCNGFIAHECSQGTEAVGYCIGGKNHGNWCASNNDCPENVFVSISGGQMTEYGTCVGVSLDQGKLVPESVGNKSYNEENVVNGVARITGPAVANGDAYERLAELFVRWYGTWGWSRDLNHYIQKNAGQSRARDISGGGVDFRGEDYKHADMLDPVYPKIYSLGPKIAGTSKFKWGELDKFTINEKDAADVHTTGLAVMRFYAFADNNQMPLVRIKVDWGDNTGSAPYSTEGWFKNKKPTCDVPNNHKFCNGDVNLPCKPSDDDECPGTADCTSASTPSYVTLEGIKKNRLYFGNSPEACQEGYFEFTHSYRCDTSVEPCSSGTDNNCYDPATQECRFTPRVQVMDNWSWCSGRCSVRGGCFNDDDEPFCDDSEGPLGNYSWVDFGGNASKKKIIVKP